MGVGETDSLGPADHYRFLVGEFGSLNRGEKRLGGFDVALAEPNDRYRSPGASRCRRGAVHRCADREPIFGVEDPPDAVPTTDGREGERDRRLDRHELTVTPSQPYRDPTESRRRIRRGRGICSGGCGFLLSGRGFLFGHRIRRCSVAGLLGIGAAT